jgi:hypothetical protein
MAVDPVEYIDGGQQYFQRYTYADNNPYKYTDPSGETLRTLIGMVAALSFAVKVNSLVDDVKKGWAEQSETEEAIDKENEAISAGDLETAFGSGLAKQISNEQKEDLGAAMDATVSAGAVPGSFSGGLPPTSIADIVEAEVTSALEEGIKSLDKKKKQDPNPGASQSVDKSGGNSKSNKQREARKNDSKGKE